MTANIKRCTKIASVIVFGSVFLFNCEPETDNLGEQFFTGSELNVDSVDVIAYNIDNNDTIRTDASEISVGALGAFSEGVFGMQKAAYVSQVRLANYDPEFGDNPEIDSVVLVMKPLYDASESDVVTDEDYIYPVGDVPAKKVVTTYPVLKYGKEDQDLTIRVHEVTEFLGASTDKTYSDKTVGYSTELGSYVFNGKISSTAITRDSDNNSLYSHDASLRIPLSNAFFQQKIIDQEGSADLNDAANFIRYFRGVRIAVDENDGYIFRFTPSATEIVMYYKYDKDENGTITRTPATFKLPMGDLNARFGQYTYNRTDTPAAVAMSNINTTTGDAKLYAQGMGGPSFGIRIPDSEIALLKEKFKNDKIGIIGAKIRVYTDEAVWNNSYDKPSTFVFLQKDATGYLPDMSVLAAVANFSLVSAFDLTKNPAYYDFTITKSLKDVVETEAPNQDFVAHIGGFRYSETTSQLMGYQYDSRAFAPNRVVLVGSDAANNKRIQLRISYGTK
ncbi:DUF4270 family protein [Chryseobacterium sp. MFBS3-17]|uniref:DUF4270 family protein n=1 Tax=Chryseobacterium sp. MFBS3-17 TaxID=2886689 RepID=UPI001D0EFFFF|nr:DUF4270 family protein [Chryseobacterium sp. MFBS3-17]MCC2590933.1 DUF4270 domain-containing protein [Chryseobacterium sp. MFBS3-17]